MHIADVTLFFAPHSGGVKRYLLTKHAHYSSYAERRHSLVVPGAYSATCEEGLVLLRAPRIPFGGGYRLPLRRAPWRHALRELKPDLIEVGDPYHLAPTALAAAQDCGAATVAFVHSDLARVLASRCGSIARRTAEAWLRRLYARFDLVQAPSRLIAQRLRESGIERVVVQPLGVDCALFHPARREVSLRARLGLAPDTRLLIFAGRLAREKEIPLLLETFALLRAPYHLVLVGGEERQRLSDEVTLLPYEQDARRLASLIASADALVHAGAQETFGLVVLEAMACGLPVVGVRAGALPELIDARCGLIAEPGCAHSLAATIDQLYRSDRVSMGLAARARVESRYAWSSVLEAQYARYARLVRGHVPALASLALPEMRTFTDAPFADDATTL